MWPFSSAYFLIHTFSARNFHADQWRWSSRPATMFVHEVSRLQHRNDRHDAGSPPRRTGGHRCLRRLPGVLVRSFRKPEALSRLHTKAHEIHRGAPLTREAIASWHDAMSALRHDAAAGARPAGKHALHLLAMRDR